jgi:hypothetical protein
MSLLCRKKDSVSQINVPTFLQCIFSEDDGPFGMKHKAFTKTIIVFKTKNNFVVYITFNILSVKIKTEGVRHLSIKILVTFIF